MPLQKTIGQNVRKLRTDLGWSQEKLSVRSKLSLNFIGLLERGEVNVSATSIEKIAKALKIEPYLLLKKDDGKD